MPSRYVIRVREAIDRLVESLPPSRHAAPLVFSGDTGRRKAVALSFDDGPSTANTPALLDILARHRARATFFVVGDCVAGAEAILRRTIAEGHEIANHTFTHPHTVTLSRDQLRDELERTNQAIALATTEVRLVRPPYGKDRRRTAEVSGELGMTTVLWSVDSGDTSGLAAEEIAARLIAQASPGAIVLLHDGGELRKRTLDAVGLAVPKLIELGFELVTVTELLSTTEASSR
jgi:peptidoglycan/xylan/chitin deacetylase (PgdA/CDA1 family)